jgi:hypothetical protein
MIRIFLAYNVLLGTAQVCGLPSSVFFLTFGDIRLTPYSHDSLDPSRERVWINPT